MKFLSKAVCGVILVAGWTSYTSDAYPFQAVVPNLSTGWFAKPGPAESLLFGVLVLKVLLLLQGITLLQFVSQSVSTLCSPKPKFPVVFSRKQ